MRKLSFIRIASSASEKLAFTYVEDEIRPLGLTVEYQKFEDDWIEPYLSQVVYRGITSS